ncbi:MAG: FecR domain-containing protein [Dysgonamonadaceae bacterium]|jgi:ferric-dicitrate binding protein FerR (iron transport regulator)|nr:FecR domain-containing protein [Dysgonamonadaceae bacterium]
MSEQSDIAKIISKVIMRIELTADERTLLDEWSTDASHRAYFEQVTHFLPLDDYRRVTALTDESAHLRRITAQIHARRRPLLLRMLRIAVGAAAVVLFGLLIHYIIGDWQSAFDTPAVTASSTEAIAPAADPDMPPKVSNRRVILKVAGGKTYSLGQIPSSARLGGAQYDVSRQMISYDAMPPAKLHPVDALNELAVQRGADFSLTLSDGTRVWLNADTRIKYPTRFTSGERRVWLSGEAYFEVAHDAEHPFIVSVDGVDVRVCGTTFNINTRCHGTIATTLVEGSVAVIPSGADHETLLTPGHTAEFAPTTGLLDINDRDIQLYIGWKTGQYHFEKITLDDLLNEIGRWHDVKIRFADEHLRTEQFTGVIGRRFPLRTILLMLEETNYIECDMHDGVITVKEKQYQLMK